MTRFAKLSWLLLFSSPLFCPALQAKCVPFSEALHHVGESRCVTGKIFHVQQGSNGIHYLDFCEDYRACTFTVVIFRGDLKHVGDIRQLQDRLVEVHGDVKEYDGRAEIILKDSSQLGGDGARIPRLPKDFDVAEKGHFSAGTFSHPRSSSSTTSRKRQTASLPTAVPQDSDSE
ncbi:MAG: hypothetical protein ACRD4I_15625 [Candidatus Angelobacter sp.]